MKKLFTILSFILLGGCSYAFYDFCETPQDYNTFPASYDFRTEYWKDIPQYHNNEKNKIKYKNIKNSPSKRTIIKQSPEMKNNDEAEIQVN
ncbi:MAG: hypothetical protein LUB59_06910 [Candidatus Gastranaerophilales bacterium]|nr:hypothetical protein [Candidatus Gastranaerophilales bacterium]